MHYLKLFLSKPFYLALLLLIALLTLGLFYKRGKLNKNSVTNIIIISTLLIITCFGFFYYSVVKGKQTSYQPARIIEGVVTK